MTRLDRLISMTPEQLADLIMDLGVDNDIEFCPNTKECGDKVDADIEIPDDDCKQCLIKWLQEDICTECFGAANGDCGRCVKNE